ncbi:MAG: hypothetical protein WD512_03370 [Candidatus Paceibacterota bacterium]
MTQLKTLVEKRAKAAMQRSKSSVQRTVIQTGKDKVQTEVYDVYDPGKYVRTGQLKEDWKVESTSDGIAVFSNRYDDNVYVSAIVESGEGYTQDFPYTGIARPFTNEAYLELKDSNKLREAFKDDLKASGFRVV